MLEMLFCKNVCRLFLLYDYYLAFSFYSYFAVLHFPESLSCLHTKINTSIFAANTYFINILFFGFVSCKIRCLLVCRSWPPSDVMHFRYFFKFDDFSNITFHKVQEQTNSIHVTNFTGQSFVSPWLAFHIWKMYSWLGWIKVSNS